MERTLPRSEEVPLLGMLGWKEAMALVGPRRAGKSTLARRLLYAWQAQGKTGDYIDLESFGAPATPDGLLKFAAGIPKGGLLVIDEVQEAKGWEKFVRQEVEYERHHVLVTGSNASLLSTEIASSLGGRAFPQKVLPLSYSDARSWGTKDISEHLRIGGYPECVLRPTDATRLHKLYFESTILRDVAARKGIREIKPLSDLALLLLSETGKVISSKKTAESLGISQPTMRAFEEALCNAMLLIRVLPLKRSPRERLVADAKHYAIDTGLQASVSISESEDEGRRLENLVAVELYRRGYDVSYYSGTRECDFIASKTGEPTLAVQVCSAKDMPQREVEGLAEGMKAASARGLLLTTEKSDAKLTKGAENKTVENWLLDRTG